ncbi:YbdK family carboxylate-amine ligase [Legionella impletisoli]|uniref:Putative glutamate--cysteine ligase 2 n=1 Tax=Legionella impletisoli TaxID=343510 RepID=A0A917JM97_9GAMM|nr:YbdK family carboxylate-amine ligase [Legionella impletisoli]GGI76564.1 putative glutamate--cysteine ligase 2 [Legionella impletisoli]
MQVLPFKQSNLGTIGVEVELQIINSDSFKLTSWAKEILDELENTKYQNRVNHEITQGMIEINTTVHESPEDVHSELLELQAVLLKLVHNKKITYCGGGTHPFQDWHDQKIFPDPRYKRVLKKFQFLCQQATIFGQHVHFGCETAEDAIYLTHALAQYTPHFIALSSSSPFFQSIDSGFCSSRNTQFNAFPICGYMPFIENWNEFSKYFFHLKHLGLVESMKDVYWDIRPKPEFGTVEVRILDTPLTLKRAAALAAFIQALSLYLIQEKPITPSKEFYFLYSSNRFQASRYGMEGKRADCINYQNHIIRDELLELFETLKPYSKEKSTGELFNDLHQSVIQNECDATLLREKYNDTHSLEAVVAEQCNRWLKHSGDRL